MKQQITIQESMADTPHHHPDDHPEKTKSQSITLQILLPSSLHSKN